MTDFFKPSFSSKLKEINYHSDGDYSSDDDSNVNLVDFDNLPQVEPIKKDIIVLAVEPPRKKTQEVDLRLAVVEKKTIDLHMQRDFIIGSPIERVNLHSTWRFTRKNPSRSSVPYTIHFPFYVFISPFIEYTIEIKWEIQNGITQAIAICITNIERIAWNESLFRKMFAKVPRKSMVDLPIFTTDYETFIEQNKEYLTDFSHWIHFETYKSFLKLCDYDWRVFSVTKLPEFLWYYPIKINTGYLTLEKKGRYDAYYRIVDAHIKETQKPSIYFTLILDKPSFNKDDLIYLENNNAITMHSDGFIELNWITKQINDFKDIKTVETYEIDFLSKELNECMKESAIVATNQILDKYRDHENCSVIPTTDKIWIVHDAHYKTITDVLDILNSHDKPSIRGIIFVGMKGIISPDTLFYQQKIPLFHYDTLIPYVSSHAIKMDVQATLNYKRRTKYIYSIPVSSSDASIYCMSYKRDVIRKIVTDAPQSKNILFVCVHERDVYTLNKYIHSLDRLASSRRVDAKNTDDALAKIRRFDIVRNEKYDVFIVKKTQKDSTLLKNVMTEKEMTVTDLQGYTLLDCCHISEVQKLKYKPSIVVLFTTPQWKDLPIKECFLCAETLLIVSGVLQI